MPWGRKSADGSHVNDLVEKVTKNELDTLFVLKFRTFGAWLASSCCVHRLTVLRTPTGEAEAKKIAAALKTNTAMLEFYASGHDIGLGGASAFADMLTANSTLARLCIGHAEFGDECLARLCMGLVRNTG